MAAQTPVGVIPEQPPQLPSLQELAGKPTEKAHQEITGDDPVPSLFKSEKVESVANTVDDRDQSESDTEVAIDHNNDDGTPQNGDKQWVTGLSLLMILGSITLVVFLMLLDVTIVATAIPQITTEFQSLNDVGWYGSAYNLASAALQPLSGKLYSNFKTKWTFMAFVLLFLVGSLICGIAKSSAMLVIGRAVAGMGTSGIQNGALTIITDTTPLHKRPKLMGIMLGLGQMGIVVGPLLGGAITEYSTWRWCFYLNLPIGAVSLLILLFTPIPDKKSLLTLPQSAKSVRSLITTLDLPGSLIFAPASIMVLMALEFGGREYPWSSATVVGLFAAGFAAFLIFVAWEWKGAGEANAMIPLQMVAQREVWVSALVGLLAMGGHNLVPGYFVPIYFQSVGGETPLMSGVFTLPNILSSLVLAVVSGILVGKLGYLIPWVLFSAIVSAVGGGLFTMLHPDSSRATWIGYQIVLGVGRGASLQMPLLAVQAVLSQDKLPMSMAFIIFSQTFGGAVFLAMGNTIFSNSLVDKLVENVPDIDLPRVLAAGANGFRAVVPPEQLSGVLWAYSDSLNLIFYLPVASAILMFGLAWGMGWNDLRKKTETGMIDKGNGGTGGAVDAV